MFSFLGPRGLLLEQLLFSPSLISRNVLHPHAQKIQIGYTLSDKDKYRMLYKDPTHAMFSEWTSFKDIKYHILIDQPDQTRPWMVFFSFFFIYHSFFIYHCRESWRCRTLWLIIKLGSNFSCTHILVSGIWTDLLASSIFHIHYKPLERASFCDHLLRVFSGDLLFWNFFHMCCN